VSAGVARNYDQVWFGDSFPLIFTPLLFSALSGLWLFAFVRKVWTRERDKPPEAGESKGRSALSSFFGVFWMTAPLAWLYAIPVERWFDETEAARWNISLLAIVAIWRVMLMSRAVSVIGGWPFLYSLTRVAIPASLETIALMMAGSLTAKRIMADMAGLRNSPAEEVITHAYSFTSGAMFMVLAGSLLMLGFYWKSRPPAGKAGWVPHPRGRPWHLPWVFLILTAAFWTLASIKPQQEQRLSQEAVRLEKEKNWAGLVSFLSKHEAHEFAPSVPLPPAVYEYSSWERISSVLAELSPATPAWIRRLYLSRLEELLSLDDYRRFLIRNSDGGDKTFSAIGDRIFSALEKLDEGPAVARRNAEELRQLITGDYPGKHGERMPENPLQSLSPRLTKLLQKAESTPP
jgi:hypothetical protein